MANLGSLGSLFVDLAANTATFESDMGRAARISEKRAKEIAKAIDDAAKVVVTASIVIGTAMAAGVKKAVDDADSLSKAAQKVGVDIENLSKLKYAGTLSDLDFETLSGSLGKFNKSIVEAAGGSKEQAEAFDLLGVKVVDVDGKLRATTAVLNDVADVFATSEDNAAKSAIAMALFGKSGADLIPLLNSGSKGLREAGDEAQRFGLVISQQAGAAAEQFNDNLTRVESAAHGLFNQLSVSLLPTMSRISEEMADAAKNADGLTGPVHTVDSLIRSLATGAIVANATLKVTGTTIGGLAAALDKLADSNAFNPFKGGILGALVRGDDRRDLGAAVGTIGETYSDVRESVSRDMESIAKLWEEQGKKLDESAGSFGKQGGASEETGKKILGYAAAQEKAAKKTKEAKLELDDHAKALMEADEATQQQREQMKQLGESMTRQVLTPYEQYITRLKEVQGALDAGVISQETYGRQALLAADEYTAALNQQADAAQRAAIQVLELQQRQREEADRGIRSDPMARAFGVGSLEELEQRSDVMKAAALEMGDALNSAFSKAGDSLSEMITNMILFGDEGDISAKKIAAALIQDVVQGFVKVGIQMAANFALSKILGATSTGVALAEAASLSAAWAPAAAGASIATYGSAAAAGSAGLVTTYGLAESLAALSAFGLANGGPAHAGGLYEVGEMNRPELAYFQGKQYLIPGNQGGMVRPLDEGARSVSGGGGAAGMTVINKAPGLVLTRRGNELTIDMVPALAELISSKTIARARSEVRGGRGLGADVVAKTGTQGRPLRPRS